MAANARPPLEQWRSAQLAIARPPAEEQEILRQQLLQEAACEARGEDEKGQAARHERDGQGSALGGETATDATRISGGWENALREGLRHAVQGPAKFRTLPDKDGCLAQLAQAQAQRDDAIRHKDAKFLELQMGVIAARERKNVAILECDNLRRLNDWDAPPSEGKDVPPFDNFLKQLAQARAQRDMATTQRDELEKERDALQAVGADTYYREQIAQARTECDAAIRERDGFRRQCDALQPSPRDTPQVVGFSPATPTYPGGLTENDCKEQLAQIRVERDALVRETEAIVLELLVGRDRITREGDEVVIERDALREAQQANSQRAGGPFFLDIPVAAPNQPQQSIPGIPHQPPDLATPLPIHAASPILDDCPDQLVRARTERDMAIVDLGRDRNSAVRQRDEAIAQRDEAVRESDALRSSREEDSYQELLAQTQIRLDSVSELCNDAIAERDQARRNLATRTAERNGARQRVRLLEEEAREAQIREAECRKQLRHNQGQDNPIVVALIEKLASLQQSFEERVTEALSGAEQRRPLVNAERDHYFQQVEIGNTALQNAQAALHEAEQNVKRLEAELEDARAERNFAQNEARVAESASDLQMKELEQEHRQELALSSERAHLQARIAEEAIRDWNGARAERDNSQKRLLDCERDAARVIGVEFELPERLPRDCEGALETTLQRVDELEELLKAANVRANTAGVAAATRRRANDRHRHQPRGSPRGSPSEQELFSRDQQPAGNLIPPHPPTPPPRSRIRVRLARRVPPPGGVQEDTQDEPSADLGRRQQQRSTRNPAPNYGAPSSRKRKASDPGSKVLAKRR